MKRILIFEFFLYYGLRSKFQKRKRKKSLFFFIYLISFHWSLNTLLRMFALLVDGLRASLSLQYKLSVLVQLQFGYDDLWRMNADGYGSAIGLLTLYTLNVNDIFASVTLQYFARLLAFVVTSWHLIIIITISIKFSLILINFVKKNPPWLHHLYGLVCYVHCISCVTLCSMGRSLFSFLCEKERWSVFVYFCVLTMWLICWISFFIGWIKVVYFKLVSSLETLKIKKKTENRIWINYLKIWLKKRKLNFRTHQSA